MSSFDPFVGDDCLKLILLLQVKARDDDSGTNAEITYSVSDDHFRVDNKGIIYNRKTLDADDNNAYYEFTVTSTDRGMMKFYYDGLLYSTKCFNVNLNSKEVVNNMNLHCSLGSEFSFLFQVNQLRREQQLYASTPKTRMTKNPIFHNKYTLQMLMRMLDPTHSSLLLWLQTRMVTMWSLASLVELGNQASL